MKPVFTCFLILTFFSIQSFVLAADKVVIIPLRTTAKIKNVISVSQNGGDYSDPISAINSISNANATNPYLIIIGPGVYSINQPIIMKEYVSIAGTGTKVTKLKGAITSASVGPSAAIISGASNASLSGVTIENTGGYDISIGIYNNGTNLSIQDVIATCTGSSINYGIYNISSATIMQNVSTKGYGGNVGYGVYNTSSSSIMKNCDADGAGNTYGYGIYNQSSSPKVVNCVANGTTHAGGAESYGVYNNSGSPVMINVYSSGSGANKNHGVRNSSSPVTMRNVVATGSDGTTNHGIYNYFSSPEMTNVSATGSGGTVSYGVYNDSSSPIIRRSTLQGETSGVFTFFTNTSTISQSTIIGGVGTSNGGSNVCVASDDGIGNMLNSDCTSPLP